MKPRYFQIGLESKVSPLRDVKSNGQSLEPPLWKTLLKPQKVFSKKLFPTY